MPELCVDVDFSWAADLSDKLHELAILAQQFESKLNEVNASLETEVKRAQALINR